MLNKNVKDEEKSVKNHVLSKNVKVKVSVPSLETTDTHYRRLFFEKKDNQEQKMKKIR